MKSFFRNQSILLQHWWDRTWQEACGYPLYLQGTAKFETVIYSFCQKQISLNWLGHSLSGNYSKIEFYCLQIRVSRFVYEPVENVFYLTIYKRSPVLSSCRCRPIFQYFFSSTLRSIISVLRIFHLFKIIFLLFCTLFSSKKCFRGSYSKNIVVLSKQSIAGLENPYFVLLLEHVWATFCGCSK